MIVVEFYLHNIKTATLLPEGSLCNFINRVNVVASFRGELSRNTSHNAL